MDNVFKEFISLYFVFMLVIIQLGIFIAAKLSGWSFLATKYLDRDSSYITYRRFQSMRMGWCNFSACMSFAVAPEGLHMKIFFLFSAGHPPLLIPWKAFKHVNKSRWRFFLGHTFIIDDEGKGIKLRLPEGVSNDILTQGDVISYSN